MYDLSNTIFCPIGSALTKHPVASQIWTHNSKRLAYTLTALKDCRKGNPYDRGDFEIIMRGCLPIDHLVLLLSSRHSICLSNRLLSLPILMTVVQSFGVFRVTRVFQFSRVYVIIVHYMIPPCRKQCYGHQQKEFC